MSPDWSSSAGFVIVLVLFLAAIGVATLAVAAWTLLVARWEDRRRTYVITQRTELAAQPVHDGTAAGLWALEPRLAQRDRDVRLLRGES